MKLSQTGYKQVDDETFATYLQGGRLDELAQNEYVLHDDKAMRFDGKQLQQLNIRTFKDKFKPKNELQACAFDLMDNFDIPVKVLCGLAGSGKTKVGIRFAAEHLLKGKVDKIVIVRNNESMGNELGYFSGNRDEKTMNWMLPIRDIAPELYFKIQSEKPDVEVEFTTVGMLMGRDFQRAAILVDDSQLLTREQTKLCGERVGEGGYIAFLGDYNQAYKEKYKKNNGLIALIEQFYTHHMFGMVEFKESVRSPIAELFATMEV